MRCYPGFVLLVLGLLACPQIASAGDVTLAWDANTEPELVGYYLCYGQASGQYSVQVDVGNVIIRTVSNLPAGTYYFAVKAYGIEGLESAYSNEVSATVAAADIQAPTISGVVSSSISTSGATIAWTTDEAADTQVEYGITTGYGSSTTLNSTLSTSHSQSLTGLAAGTTYHYRVKSKDAAGNPATSSDYTFTTAAPPDTSAPAISSVASSGITSSGATISWTTNEAADTQVQYGTTTSYGSSTTLNRSLSTSHSQALTGLTDSTTYHYRVRSMDAAGNLAASRDYAFTTATAPDIDPPIISNVSVSRVSGTRAVITWTTNEAADSDIDYGITTSYGYSALTGATRSGRITRVDGLATSRPKNVAPSTDTALVTSHSLILNNLDSETTYHFRVKSKDAADNQAVSHDYTFATTSAADIRMGLAAAYSFDEGSGAESADYSPNGNSASLHAATWTAGKFGRALAFNGIDSYVTAGTRGLPATDQPQSISCWVSATDRTKSAKTILALANPELRVSLQHGHKNSEAGILDFENEWAVVGTRPSSGKWHHVGYIYDGAQNSFYLDGNLVSRSNIRQPAAAITSFELGRWIDGSEYFEGSIDDVRIYDRALTEEELKLAMVTPVGEAGTPADAKPVISLQLESRSYDQGQPVKTSEFWLSNPSGEAIDVELQTWIELPGMQPISLGSLGIGENLSLEPGFNQDYGVLPLMEISADAPAGVCRFGARLVDPVTGEVLSESVQSFSIGRGKTLVTNSTNYTK